MILESIAWLGELSELIGSLIPRRVLIPPTHGGVKYKRMKKIIPLTSGRYWYWPFISEIHTTPITEQTIALTDHTLETKDGQTVRVHGVITYEVADVEKALVRKWDFEDSIDDEAAAAYCTYITTKSFEYIQSDRKKVNIELTRKVRSQLNEYGIKVIRAQITTFASGVPIIHMGNTSE